MKTMESAKAPPESFEKKTDVGFALLHAHVEEIAIRLCIHRLVSPWSRPVQSPCPALALDGAKVLDYVGRRGALHDLP